MLSEASRPCPILFPARASVDTCPRVRVLAPMRSRACMQGNYGIRLFFCYVCRYSKFDGMCVKKLTPHSTAIL